MTVLASGGLGAGLTGFLVVVVLIAACVFLFRSMSKHLRKVPKSFDDPARTEPGDESVGR